VYPRKYTDWTEKEKFSIIPVMRSRAGIGGGIKENENPSKEQLSVAKHFIDEFSTWIDVDKHLAEALGNKKIKRNECVLSNNIYKLNHDVII
jgi:hypothetical protein